MFLVNLSKTWPQVRAGAKDPAEATLGDWPGIKEDDLETHADAILGIFKNVVVTAYDIEGQPQRKGGRVRFIGRPSRKWAHLVGTPNPGRPWVQGYGRPVQVLDTRVLTQGNVPIEDSPSGQRAVVSGYVLTVSEDGCATLLVPDGGKATVIPLSSESISSHHAG
jgi:hypothetical protein